MKQRNEEISNLRRELRERDETIQQREIEISCLRGQVNKAMGRVTRAILELDSVKDVGSDSSTLTFSGSDLAREFFFLVAPWVTVLMMEGCGLRDSRSSSSLSSISWEEEVCLTLNV